MSLLMGATSKIWIGRARARAARFSGQEPSLTRELADTMCWNRRFRCDKAIRALGYQPSPMEDGIEECQRWYQARGELDGRPG